MAYRFYGHNPAKKGWMFSNFSDQQVIMIGLAFPTSEHYFQYMKFVTTDPNWAEQIRVSPNPTVCKKMGGSRAHPLRADWEEVKDQVMKDVLIAKAEQHKIFRDELLSTGNATIIEASPYDYYWGEGKDGSGKNMLGVLLMEVREELKAK